VVQRASRCVTIWCCPEECWWKYLKLVAARKPPLGAWRSVMICPYVT